MYEVVSIIDFFAFSMLYELYVFIHRQAHCLSVSHGSLLILYTRDEDHWFFSCPQVICSTVLATWPFLGVEHRR